MNSYCSKVLEKNKLTQVNGCRNDGGQGSGDKQMMGVSKWGWRKFVQTRVVKISA